MALFRGTGKKLSKADLLRRLQARDFAEREELDALLAELVEQRDMRVDELVPLLSSSEPGIRAAAEGEFRKRLDARGVEGLLKGLAGKPARAQADVLHALLRASVELTKGPISTLVRDGDTTIARTAMEALSTLNSRFVGPEFNQFLQHPRVEVRRLALIKVQESPALVADPVLRRTLFDLADDKDDQIRLRLLDMLSQVDAAEASRVCLALLNDPSPGIQQKAVRTMSSLLDRLGKSGEAEDQIFSLLADGAEAVRNGLLEMLLRRSDRDAVLRRLLLFAKTQMGWMRDRTLQSLRRYTAELTPAVIQLMSDQDEDVRSMALTLGATLEAKEAVPHIVGLLRDPDWWLRMIAAETLGKIGDARAVDALIQSLDDPDSAIVCIDALARIKDKRATAALAKLLSRDELEIRVAALEALVKLKDPRCLPVVEACAVHDPSRGVRDRAGIAAEQLRGRVGRVDTAGSMAAITDEVLGRGRQELMPLERLLVEARNRSASDLHILVDARATFRVHGQLVDADTDLYDSARAEAELTPLIPRSKLAEFEKNRQVDFCHTIDGVGRYRCNVYVERKGLAGAFRTIPNDVPTLADIGMPNQIGDVVNLHQGLVVVAGPSGSGKSTTLAALVNLFNESRRSHVLLLEDPIEFVHPQKACLINQREVDRHTRSFASALRGALRQDPDVIVVGQMRDPETVRLAIEASETGHLVIATMNTTSAPKTVDRIIEAFPVAEQTQIRVMLSETLKFVVCQNLLPRADGDGRVALFEVMMATLGIRMLIRDNKTFQIPGQMQIGESKGHQTVDTALLRMLQAGQIQPQEAWRRATSKERFEARLPSDFLAAARAGTA